MAKSIEDLDKMTKPGTVQLSMNIDPDLKRRAKILAISKNITLSELVTKYIEEGLTKDEKQSK
jgi:predicted HicB family RNase H-like nuclease